MTVQPTLTTELNTILRLTHLEILIAETRRAQAGSEAIERELSANADEGRERVRLVTAAIRELGGVPDLLGAATGRLAALAKSQVEQAQPLSEALLGDLALEQQLHARARFLRVLADAAGNTQVRGLAERLEAAHAETVQWLEVRLAEVAVGGPSAIRPTPLQVAAGVARRTATLPLRGAAAAVNRSLGTLSAARGTAQEAVSEQLERAGDVAAATGEAVSQQVERAGDVAAATGEALAAGRDAALKRAEEEARAGNAEDTATAVHGARAAAGSLEVDELPIPAYDELTAARVREELRTLTSPADVRAVLAYEQRHAGRSSVVSAAQARIGALARADLDETEPEVTPTTGELEALTVLELRERAQDADIEGRSGMNKQELVAALRKA